MSATEPHTAELAPWIAGKILSRHRARLAMVYVRQSTPHQVLEHRESAALQYALQRRAVDWGWPADRVVIVDQDQGRSGASAEGRSGFQHLLAEVGLDHVGLVLGVEMSRLARSCRDWYQLLELCAIFGVLLGDHEGLYDPQQYNDRLLLGLKGTISEAELHLLRQRTHQGVLNKARRGELWNHLPRGYVCGPNGELQIDPDQQVQSTLRLVFAKFEQIGSINGLLMYLVRHDIRLPVRSQFKANKNELQWRRPDRTALANLLHHPVYAGAYCWGRRPTDPKRKVTGRAMTAGANTSESAPPTIFIRDRCPAYISWEQHQANLHQMAQNRSRWDRRGPARGGGALLAGLVICAKCGCRLLVGYADGHRPRYTCMRRRITYGEGTCQSLSGRRLEELVERQVLRLLEPAGLELTLAAAADITQERRLLHQQWRQRLERARYDSERAARQYHTVDPENRLVAGELERRWEQALLAHRGLQEQYERFQAQQPPELSADERRQIQQLAHDIPALWRAPHCTATDRQEIVRHLVERVVVRGQTGHPLLEVDIHFVGGFVSHHELRLPVSRWDRLPDWPRLTQRLTELADGQHTAGQIAHLLNREGFHPPKQRHAFNAPMVLALLSRRGLCRKRPATTQPGLLGPDEWWLDDLARALDIPPMTIHNWIHKHWLHARQLKGRHSRWIVWADRDEVVRLRSLRTSSRGWRNRPQSTELTTPKPRPSVS